MRPIERGAIGALIEKRRDSILYRVVAPDQMILRVGNDDRVVGINTYVLRPFESSLGCKAIGRMGLSRPRYRVNPSIRADDPQGVAPPGEDIDITLGIFRDRPWIEQRTTVSLGAVFWPSLGTIASR